MIRITKIVDSHIVDEKLDLDALQKELPHVDEEIRITFVATQKERKADSWTKKGKRYVRIILDYNNILTSTKEVVVNIMKDKTVEVITKE